MRNVPASDSNGKEEHPSRIVRFLALANAMNGKRGRASGDAQTMGRWLRRAAQSRRDNGGDRIAISLLLAERLAGLLDPGPSQTGFGS